MRIKMKSVISALLASVMLIGTIPAVTYAAQVNEYTDPADNWLKANGRTNELDMNATTTYETGYCTAGPYLPRAGIYPVGRNSLKPRRQIFRRYFNRRRRHG